MNVLFLSIAFAAGACVGLCVGFFVGVAIGDALGLAMAAVLLPAFCDTGKAPLPDNPAGPMQKFLIDMRSIMKGTKVEKPEVTDAHVE